MDQNNSTILGFGYCHLSIIPIRQEPDHRAEMTSQLLFGETFRIIGKQKSWYLIRCTFDDDTGWIEEKQFAEISNAEYMRLVNMPAQYNNELVQILCDLKANRMFPLLMGSSLPGISDQQFTIGNTLYSYEGTTVKPSDRVFPNQILETAYIYLHAPYMWAGRSPFGIDCSGFVQMVFKLCGIPLLRNSYQQVAQGEVVNLQTEARAADLAFFDNAEGEISHVGILIDQTSIIHASGSVKINQFDHYGIFDQYSKKYTHKLRVIKRII